MLKLRTRRNISLVLFIGLLLVSGGVWSMVAEDEGMKDGVYSGQATGFGGELIVDVTISGGQITDLQVRPHDETPFIADSAIETLIENILQAQSPNVEVVSGATYTSEALIKAVEQAIAKASIGFEDGVFIGNADGFGGPLQVEVTVSGGSIAQVEILENSETPFIADPAFEQLTAAIVANQSWSVDVVSGATYTSEAVMAAVEDALTN